MDFLVLPSTWYKDSCSTVTKASPAISRQSRSRYSEIWPLRVAGRMNPFPIGEVRGRDRLSGRD